jgi:hypothetical protein
MRGRIQSDYYNYQTEDTVNHLTNVNTHVKLAPDESLFEIKRMRLIFAGYMLTPDLRFQIQLDGNTRGLNTEDTRQDFYNNHSTSHWLENPVGSARKGMRRSQTM